MDSDLNIDDQWVVELARQRPQACEQLEQLAQHLRAKRQLMNAMIGFCADHPELPMMRMYAEYSAALDGLAVSNSPAESSDHNDGTTPLGPRQRSAQTKQARTRAKLVEATAKVIAEGYSTTSRLEDIAAIAGVSVPTLYNHFNTRDELIAAAYHRLVAVGLQLDPS